MWRNAEITQLLHNGCFIYAAHACAAPGKHAADSSRSERSPYTSSGPCLRGWFHFAHFSLSLLCRVPGYTRCRADGEPGLAGPEGHVATDLRRVLSGRADRRNEDKLRFCTFLTALTSALFVSAASARMQRDLGRRHGLQASLRGYIANRRRQAEAVRARAPFILLVPVGLFQGQKRRGEPDGEKTGARLGCCELWQTFL